MEKHELVTAIFDLLEMASDTEEEMVKVIRGDLDLALDHLAQAVSKLEALHTKMEHWLSQN